VQKDLIGGNSVSVDESSADREEEEVENISQQGGDDCITVVEGDAELHGDGQETTANVGSEFESGSIVQDNVVETEQEAVTEVQPGLEQPVGQGIADPDGDAEDVAEDHTAEHQKPRPARQRKKPAWMTSGEYIMSHTGF